MVRNPLIDNVKFIMIFFVVLGHLIEPLLSHNSTLSILFKIIYSFHMPVFIIISGPLGPKFELF